MVLNLMVHAGGWEATRDEVVAVPTPAPSKRHYPVPHGDLIDLIQKTVERTGLQVVDEAFALSHEGNRMFGLLGLKGPDDRPDYQQTLGFRSAHDQSMKISTAAGSRIFVCDNMAFTGEDVVHRMHTRHAMDDLPGLLTASIGRLGDLRADQNRRFDAYKEYELTDTQVNDTLIHSLDAGVISSSKIRQVLDEYREPRHPEFREGGMTAWRLFNAYTEILKGANLFEVPKRTQALHGLMDMVVGVN
jgi:hypothetical protein